ncbi:MAG TPA: hypothetical protein VG166_00455 [Caulobacteraceae bacterium]|nr:hypothetical protein [Caulobacteraceae bacterium]
MATTIRNLLLGAAALASAAAFAPAAMAGCGAPVTIQPSSWQAPNGPANPSLVRVSNPMASIVGMWSFKFIVGGHTIGWGYQVWHEDGTEITNSGDRAPATENFCMGVWGQSSANRYSLNHFALSYDANGNLNAKVNIKETVTVNPSATVYDGPFSFDIYDPKTGALLQHIDGTVTAHRVTLISTF